MTDKKYTSIKHENAAGRVEFDGGKAVWQWAQSQNDSTSILIKSLDNPQLALERTQKTPIPHKPSTKVEAKGRGSERPRRSIQGANEHDSIWQLSTGHGAGFDPYNRS